MGYWKNPNLKEALQIERCCSNLENDMAQMLLPLANVAREINSVWKGRLRAVTLKLGDEEDGEETGRKILLPWQDVPYMRELLRRLGSILCRKPGPDESTGVRPLLLDLQGTSRHNRD